MSDRDKFVFNGKLIEKDSEGKEISVLNQDNITAGSDISVEKSGDNITISSNLGITVNSDGLLCAVFEKEEE